MKQVLEFIGYSIAVATFVYVLILWFLLGM